MSYICKCEDGKEFKLKAIGWYCPKCKNKDMVTKKNHQCACFINTDDNGRNFINMINKNKIHKQWQRIYKIQKK